MIFYQVIEVVYNPIPTEIINIEARKELGNARTFYIIGGC